MAKKKNNPPRAAHLPMHGIILPLPQLAILKVLVAEHDGLRTPEVTKRMYKFLTLWHYVGQDPKKNFFSRKYVHELVRQLEHWKFLIVEDEVKPFGLKINPELKQEVMEFIMLFEAVREKQQAIKKREIERERALE